MKPRKTKKVRVWALLNHKSQCYGTYFSKREALDDTRFDTDYAVPATLTYLTE